MTKRTLEIVGAVVVVVVAVGALVVSRARGQNVPEWISQDGNWSAGKAALQAFGERFQTSEAMYDALKKKANGGKRPTWAQMAEPAFDWSGVYTRSKLSLQYDLDLSGESGPTSAALTPAGQAVVKAKADQLARTGGEYDPLSDCRPPGTPRWFTEPFLKEWVVTPNQTWLMNEMVNDVRRVYTDGRDHTPEDDAYPSWNGDTIGFWDGDVLVAHTKYLYKGQYQRGVQPNYSEKTTVVERWHKADPKTLQADVWVFDPVNLAKPWYTRQSWTKLTDDEKQLRLRYWDCRENTNNEIVVTKEGTSQFAGFTFAPKEGKTDHAK
ncbi:MAG TPA: hypothetical protein VFP91_13760 [Vicinamibacterales bacterium]|nr:hypothetical protein [Vicinamibacterales bacterium]